MPKVPAAKPVERQRRVLDEVARETLALLHRAEVSHREERRIQMGTGIAKSPCQRTLEAFDFAAQPTAAHLLFQPSVIEGQAGCGA